MTNETVANDAGSNDNNLGAVWKFAHVETPEWTTTALALARARLREIWQGLVLVVYQCNITGLKLIAVSEG